MNLTSGTAAGRLCVCSFSEDGGLPLPLPPAPREVFKRAGGGKMGPRKMKRIPDGGSQPSQSQASQSQASQGW